MTQTTTLLKQEQCQPNFNPLMLKMVYGDDLVVEEVANSEMDEDIRSLDPRGEILFKK
jgi:hypothetical protein